ncbi:hypothetical protein [uncultured Lacinutrix sp.]|uniref:hypothetical protein n=1 Tax=uncultured Lacinutrix sp. TaxID=574032 RepID=UPI00260E39C2|nr:hypothetical protein [uncultured Lacinutrix sp.]
MAGYMGFGMQSWIYKRKMRKPFSKRGKVPTFNPLQKYSRTFKLKPTIKRNKRLSGFITVFTIVTLVFFTFLFCNKFFEHEKAYNRPINVAKTYKNTTAFNFLLNSGISRLSNNNVHGAYSEFVLAHKINPDNDQVINLLIETTNILCEEDIYYCNELEKFLKI